ncbi:MAG: hypothetical protein JW807_17585 [Spirochaetes bacterium]|nr:hypothetical protein [Spirochaetota bacterium]
MKQRALTIILTMLIFVPAFGHRPYPARDAVSVRVISDNGSEYQKYRAHPRVCRPGDYFYMEAVKGERYSIEVANRTSGRIAVVIAVDGRNIISGAKSYLKNTERMYLIEPYATGTFEGWRTGMVRTNRFYFTGASDSYAEKVFADASAMGTIAVAAYREKARKPVPITPRRKDKLSRSRGEGQNAASEKAARDDEAGTGFGETTWSPAYEVPFEPESAVAGRVVLKYEWRSELCRKGIVRCERPNRLWPLSSNGFAPVPRDFVE